MVFAIALIGTFSAFYPHGSLNILLPTIAHDLSVSTGLIVIINIAYSLVTGVLTLPFGRLGDRIGYQKLFITGQAVLIVSNILSAFLSLNFVLLVIFRCILAVGSAMVQSVVQAMLTQAYPKIRGRMMGLYSLSISYCGSFSPLISGALSDCFSWRAALLFGVIFSIVALILGVLFLGRFQSNATKSDHLGTVLLMVTLTSLLLNLNSRTITIPLPVMLLTLGIFAVSLPWFIHTESRAESPLLDFSLLKNKDFSLGFLGCLLGYMVSTGANTALPFFIQDIKGETATVASLCTMGFSLVMGTLGPFTGGWCDKKGPYRFILAAVLIQLVSVVGYTTLSERSPLALVVICVVLYGLGGGLFYAPISSMVMGSVPPDSGGVASGMMSTARSLGGAIGTTIFSLAMGLTSTGATLTSDPARYRAEYLSGQRLVMLIMLALHLASIVTMLYLFLTRGRKSRTAA